MNRENFGRRIFLISDRYRMRSSICRKKYVLTVFLASFMLCEGVSFMGKVFYGR